MELASDPVGGVGGEGGSYPMVAANGANPELQQLMVAGYGHYVDGRGELLVWQLFSWTVENQTCTVRLNNLVFLCTFIYTSMYLESIFFSKISLKIELISGI